MTANGPKNWGRPLCGKDSRFSLVKGERKIRPEPMPRLPWFKNPKYLFIAYSFHFRCVDGKPCMMPPTLLPCRLTSSSSMEHGWKGKRARCTDWGQTHLWRTQMRMRRVPSKSSVLLFFPVSRPPSPSITGFNGRDMLAGALPWHWFRTVRNRRKQNKIVQAVTIALDVGREEQKVGEIYC